MPSWRRTPLAIVSVWVCICGAPSQAAERQRLRLETSVGYSTLDRFIDDTGKGTAQYVELGPGPLVSLGLSYHPWPFVAVTAGVGSGLDHELVITPCFYGSIDLRRRCSAPVDAGLRTFEYHLGVRLVAPLAYARLLYLGAAFGAQTYKVDKEGHRVSATRGATYLQSGAQFPVRGRHSISADIRWTRLGNPAWGLEPITDVQIRLTYGLGLK